MWPWELKTVFGNGLGHTFTVAGWYVNTYPARFIVTVVGVMILLCGLAIIAGLIAKQFFAETDPAEKVFGTERSAKRKGFVK